MTFFTLFTITEFNNTNWEGKSINKTWRKKIEQDGSTWFFQIICCILWNPLGLRCLGVKNSTMCKVSEKWRLCGAWNKANNNNIHTQQSWPRLVVAAKKKCAGVFNMSGWDLKMMIGFGTQQTPTPSCFMIRANLFVHLASLIHFSISNSWITSTIPRAHWCDAMRHWFPFNKQKCCTAIANQHKRTSSWSNGEPVHPPSLIYFIMSSFNFTSTSPPSNLPVSEPLTLDPSFSAGNALSLSNSTPNISPPSPPSAPTSTSVFCPDPQAALFIDSLGQHFCLSKQQITDLHGLFWVCLISVFAITGLISSPV